MLLRRGLPGSTNSTKALAAVNEGLDGAAQGEHGHDYLFFAELLRIKGEILLRREGPGRRRKIRSAKRLNIAHGAGSAALGTTRRPRVSRGFA